MRAQHTAVDATKTLQCQQCDRSFTRPENLARHAKTHDAVHPHRCQTCGKQFSRSDLRRKHERLHERPTSLRKPRAEVKPKPRSTAVAETTTGTGERLSILLDNNDLAHMGHEPLELSGDVLPTAISAHATDHIMTSGHLFDQTVEHAPSSGTWDDGSQVDPYFDYASFARPWNYTVDPTTDASGWLSTSFFAALRETNLAVSPPFLNMTEYNGLLPVGGDTYNEPLRDTLHTDVGYEGHSNRTSRAPSPPNEASREDRIPFAWDPLSVPIVKARPIVLRSDDPIFATIDPKLEISQATLSRICDFLRAREPEAHDVDAFTIPNLPLVNTFITLFFKHFLPQGPVLHRPTVDTNALPPPLLAIIMVIGSVYSHLRHTRRFGIIVLDRIRQNLLSSIEHDNSLMREPLIIYTSALVCYMGIWCGNKRAFELAEALRAAVVTYTRRLSLGSQVSHSKEGQQTLQTQWLRWSTTEGSKRLRWFVFTLDSQFVSILGMSGMLTVAEVRKWECPCDEAFWTASTARAWKNLMGSASEPSCPVFGPVAASLLAPRPPYSADLGSSIAMPRMNRWSAELLLTVVMAEVFHFEQAVVVARMVEEDHDADELMQQSPMNERATELLQMLESWQVAYGESYDWSRSEPTSSYFHRVSSILLHLGRIYLQIPLFDLQDCIGRSGSDDASAALRRLTLWATQQPGPARRVVQEAAICISTIMSDQNESGPYDLIALFLCHIVIWAFANVAPIEQKTDVVTALRADPTVSSAVYEFVEAGFGLAYADERQAQSLSNPSQLIFKHAIQVLVQLGSWGASSNLALLLHLHPGVAI
ncbi:fungal-specific transcription factor domain-containing protein [Pyrenochaeta sp. MPI-SDFR-AT-0127]|nr:fungal-specific transcription factor domain-containing protein [Pyrenochaeta sp. MPI-SDFR-AT-0127]